MYVQIDRDLLLFLLTIPVMIVPAVLLTIMLVRWAEDDIEGKLWRAFKEWFWLNCFYAFISITTGNKKYGCTIRHDVNQKKITFKKVMFTSGYALDIPSNTSVEQYRTFVESLTLDNNRVLAFLQYPYQDNFNPAIEYSIEEKEDMVAFKKAFQRTVFHMNV